MRRNSAEIFLSAVVAILIFLAVPAAAQEIVLPPKPPAPSEYGKVVLDTYAAKSPGAVVFDHWLHRSRFTCRVCHVDIGFAMEAKATGITAESNRQGFHCGTCHDGKRVFNGKPIFAACAEAPASAVCSRCHSAGKVGVRKYEYNLFTAHFPKDYYGIDWQTAEARGIVKPVDVLEGVSVRREKMANREDFAIKTNLEWVHPVIFSHEQHSIWNGCELCHPEIFPTVRKSAARYTMFSNIEGRHCGACHLKVAFPLNNCTKCHPHAPAWAAAN
jgi:c(7)-type cytochrome triheme protein